MTLPLSTLLKTLTQPQHDEAEHHPLHAILFGSEGAVRAREAYTRLLGQHLVIQETFDPMLRQAAAQTYTFRAMVREHHLHLNSLRSDMATLAIKGDLLHPAPATSRFVSFIKSCAAHEGSALLGVWYVFEGSTNGGTIIGKKMRELLGLGEGEGTRFINPHGSFVRARWSEWKQTLDAINFDQTHRETIIAAAQETFRLSRAVLDDVYRTMRGEAQAEVVDVATSGANQRQVIAS